MCLWITYLTVIEKLKSKRVDRSETKNPTTGEPDVGCVETRKISALQVCRPRTQSPMD